MQGWECPKCHKVYAPHVDECKSCNQQVAAPMLPQLPYIPYIPPTIAPSPYIVPSITRPHTVPIPEWPGYPNPYIGDWPIDPPYKVTCLGASHSLIMTSKGIQ